jgi:hypothetical protein
LEIWAATFFVPGQKRLDISLSKNTRIHEDISMEARWDVFNVFKTVHLARPNSMIGDAGTDCAKITDTIGARMMQFGLKVLF